MTICGEAWSILRRAAAPSARRRSDSSPGVMAALNATFDPESRTRQHRFLRRLPDADFGGRALFAALGLGPDRSPDWTYTADFRAEMLA